MLWLFYIVLEYAELLCVTSTSQETCSLLFNISTSDLCVNVLLKLEKSLSLTQQFNSMCVFQILLAAFIDPHNKFNTSPLAECYYCQVPGMQSSVPLMMHKPERDIVCFLFFFFVQDRR